MKKKMLVALIFLLTIFVFGVGFWQWEIGKKAEMAKQSMVQQQQTDEIKKKEEEKQSQQNANVDTSDWNTFKNEEFGFEIKLPGDINKWSIEKKVFPKKTNVFKGDTITLYLNYDLDQSIPRVKDDPTLGVITRMSLWYINIIPINIWKQDICSSAKIEGPCRQGKVLGKNASYVFESGFPNVESGICPDLSDSQKKYCNVASEFDNNVTEKLDFKFMNN